ncbi:ABC transporter substrate-binding protein [Candidatus Epulonipiscium viviparus]|uniref:ABC transporter substrate-binding protein n=1 Tax=Candidatus Epulonipiscium viviparus TaxID=420336 RepID=UPI0027380796|nr:extracellular solute-binding protein [Candidatus Epulopiscium viviparus]
MKKFGSLIFTALAATIALAGCSTDDASSTATVPADGYTGDLIISVNSLLNNPAIVEGINALAATDKWKNVNIEVIPQSVDYIVNMPIQLMGGNRLDIVYHFNPIEFEKNSSIGLLTDLEPYVDILGIDMEARFGSHLPSAIYKDTLYGIPAGYTSWGLFYNKSIFDAANIPYPDIDTPMTWSEYRELAAKLTSGQGADKIYGALHLQWPMYWYGEAIMELGGGQHFYNEEGLSNIEHPAFRNALEQAYKMQNIDKSTPTQADVIARKIEADGFLSGQYAMYPHGTWFFNWLADEVTYPRDYEIGFAPLPIPDGTTQHQNWGVCASFAVPVTAKDPLMATDFSIDLLEYATRYSPIEAYADLSVTPERLYATIHEDIPDEGMTAENVQKVFFHPEQINLTEKVTGPNAAKYETVIDEEVEMYLAGAQDIDTTIANIKKRGDKVIQD